MAEPKSYHAILAEILDNELGIARDKIHAYLETISAPPELTTLYRVSSNSLEILPLLTNIDPERWSESRISALLEVASACLSQESIISQQVPKFHWKRGDKLGGLRNTIKAHPIYIATWKRAALPELKQQYTALQTQLINSHEVFSKYQEKYSWKDFTSMRYQSSLSIRHISENHHSKLLSLLPNEPLPLYNFYKKIKINRNNLSTNEIKNLDQIISLIN